MLSMDEMLILQQKNSVRLFYLITKKIQIFDPEKIKRTHKGSFSGVTTIYR